MHPLAALSSNSKFMLGFSSKHISFSYSIFKLDKVMQCRDFLLCYKLKRVMQYRDFHSNTFLTFLFVCVCVVWAACCSRFIISVWQKSFFISLERDQNWVSDIIVFLLLLVGCYWPLFNTLLLKDFATFIECVEFFELNELSKVFD